MGPRHIAQGSDFTANDFASAKDFGFTGSSEGYDSKSANPPFAGSKPTETPAVDQSYAKGGEHMHPHGHHVIHVEHHPDGAVVHHHAHGGFTVHHADGHMTHHAMGGEECHARGGEQHSSGEGTLVERMKGGDSEDHMAFGGAKRPHLPRNMTPKVGRSRPLGEESAVNKPPRNPAQSTTPRNAMPGGEMGMGVEPSAEPDEPDMSGDSAGGGMTQMRKGGVHHRRGGKHEEE